MSQELCKATFGLDYPKLIQIARHYYEHRSEYKAKGLGVDAGVMHSAKVTGNTNLLVDQSIDAVVHCVTLLLNEEPGLFVPSYSRDGKGARRSRARRSKSGVHGSGYGGNILKWFSKTRKTPDVGSSWYPANSYTDVTPDHLHRKPPSASSFVTGSPPRFEPYERAAYEDFMRETGLGR